MPAAVERVEHYRAGGATPGHDDDAAHDLGLQTEAVPVPWPMLAVLPSGPELSRANASVARDVVAGPP